MISIASPCLAGLSAILLPENKRGPNGRDVFNSSQTRVSSQDAMPVHLNQLGQNDVNNCLACVAWLAYLAQSQ